MVAVVQSAGLGVSGYLRDRLNEMEDWKGQREVTLPDKPYSAWLNVGDTYLGKAPRTVRNNLRQLECGGTEWDGAGLAILRPDIIKTKWFDLPGTSVGSDGVPDLVWWGVRPEFRSHWVGLAFPNFRSLVCGSKFEI